MAVTEYQAKAGRRYKAELYVGGRRAASRRGFLTKKDAKTWLHEAEQQALTGASSQPIGTAFSSVAGPYLDDMQARRQPGTYRDKKAVLNRFLTYMGGDFLLEDLTAEQIDGYFAGRYTDRGAKAANRDRIELCALLNWAIRKNMWQSNPFRVVEPYPETRFVRRVPSAEELAAVRLAATGDERDFIDTLYFTGARLSEVAKLTWEDVNMERKTITLWTRKRRKGNLEPRCLAMTEKLQSIMVRRWDSADRHPVLVYPNSHGEPHKRADAWLRTLFQRLCERAGVEYFTAHGIRHHVATRLKDSRKATIFQVKEFLGHMNLSTTERYLHELDVDRDVAEILNDALSQPTETTEASG